VNAFPGHIACDGGSKSEIVVPLVSNGTLVGVLDVDSYSYSNFDDTDKQYLESIASIVALSHF
jgi:putative methionine-R-sulfoxide reductase with GAF domain